MVVLLGDEIFVVGTSSLLLEQGVKGVCLWTGRCANKTGTMST